MKNEETRWVERNTYSIFSLILTFLFFCCTCWPLCCQSLMRKGGNYAPTHIPPTLPHRGFVPSVQRHRLSCTRCRSDRHTLCTTIPRSGLSGRSWMTVFPSASFFFPTSWEQILHRRPITCHSCSLLANSIVFPHLWFDELSHQKAILYCCLLDTFLMHMHMHCCRWCVKKWCVIVRRLALVVERLCVRRVHSLTKKQNNNTNNNTNNNNNNNIRYRKNCVSRTPYAGVWSSDDYSTPENHSKKQTNTKNTKKQTHSMHHHHHHITTISTTAVVPSSSPFSWTPSSFSPSSSSSRLSPDLLDKDSNAVIAEINVPVGLFPIGLLLSVLKPSSQLFLQLYCYVVFASFFSFYDWLILW